MRGIVVRLIANNQTKRKQRVYLQIRHQMDELLHNKIFTFALRNMELSQKKAVEYLITFLFINVSHRVFLLALSLIEYENKNTGLTLEGIR